MYEKHCHTSNDRFMYEIAQKTLCMESEIASVIMVIDEMKDGLSDTVKNMRREVCQMDKLIAELRKRSGSFSTIQAAQEDFALRVDDLAESSATLRCVLADLADDIAAVDGLRVCL